jgi:hypothetical protein
MSKGDWAELEPVTDSGIGVPIGYSNSDSRNNGAAVTDNGIKFHKGALDPDRRNTCDLCRRVVPAAEPFWRFRGWDKISMCRDCVAKFTSRNRYVNEPFSLAPDASAYHRFYIGPFVGQLYSACEGCGRLLGRVCYWPTRFCDNKCCRAAMNRNRRAKRSERKCEHCGGVFVGRSDARFCSAKCRVYWHRKSSI